ncbi:MAG: class IV adenylate cyclase [Candidatus Omnitrophica bacterium]|nr:class IV adenylate cyclase [Candidatus Omnitrophota bacterium]
MDRFEIEQKFKIEGPSAFRKKLKKLKAKKIRSGIERDRFFDFKNALRCRGCILRLRQKGDLEGLLTFKGPRFPGRFKKRLEAEVGISEIRMAERLLRLAGFRPVTGYAKKREEYRIGKTLVTLDYLRGPGWFLEIEGSRSGITEIRRKLGVSERQLEERSYLQIAKGIRGKYAA